MSAPCLKCGVQTSHAPEFPGLLDGSVFMCLPCFEVDHADFMEWRRQFEFLIDSGVPRDRANAIMIARINGEACS